MPSLQDILNAIQLKARYLFGIAALGALMLLMSQSWAEAFGVEKFREDYRGGIGIVTLTAGVFWVVQLFAVYERWSRERRRRRSVLAMLDSLSPEEMLLLAYCVIRNCRTITLDVTDRVACALASKGLLYRPAGTYSPLSYPFAVPDFLWAHLLMNPVKVLGSTPADDPELHAAFDGLERHMSRFDRRL